jgi:hypothetical protein
MTAHKRALLIEYSLVLAATVVAVVGMIHLKDHVNRSEAIRAMTQLGDLVLDDRRKRGSLPPQFERLLAEQQTPAEAGATQK